ncbi:UNVERIFIED_CONTAM: hypothetical protein GTU68_061906 [Idotea baltica]|nr:hypothetical protein [Idotea baltica]
MKSVAIYCGSSAGCDAKITDDAKRLGQTLSQCGIRLVYGGAQVGLMGVIADEVLAHGGQAIGVLPRFFLSEKEVAHESLTELILVDDMHQRKTKMVELSDGFIAMPGGFGTLEELFEVVTWAQLGIHRKPIGLLNTQGFFDSVLHQSQVMVDNGFLKIADQQLILVSDEPAELIAKMKAFEPVENTKWISDSDRL